MKIGKLITSYSPYDSTSRDVVDKYLSIHFDKQITALTAYSMMCHKQYHVLANRYHDIVYEVCYQLFREQ